MKPRSPLAGVNLNLFMVLGALFEHEHAGRAAEQLGVTPSAVSHALRELRLIFDDPLFVRGAQGLTPTQRAQAIRAQVQEGLHTLSSALVATPAFDPLQAERRFVISTADDVGPTVISRLCQRLETEAPGFVIEFRGRDAPTSELLDTARADVVLQPIEDMPSRFGTRPLFSDSFCCVVRADHPEIRQRLSKKAYTRLEHIQVIPVGYGLSRVDRRLRQLGISRKIRFYAHTFALAFELVRNTDCIMTAPMRLANALEGRSNVKLLTSPIAMPNYSIETVWSRTREEPGLQYLLQQLQACCREVYGRARTKP